MGAGCSGEVLLRILVKRGKNARSESFLKSMAMASRLSRHHGCTKNPPPNWLMIGRSTIPTSGEEPAIRKPRSAVPGLLIPQYARLFLKEKSHGSR